MLKQERDWSGWSGSTEQVRVLLGSALSPVLAGYAGVVATLAVVSALATQTDFSPQGVLLVAGPGWLGAYQVPLTIAGHPLGLLPMLATVGVCTLVARSAAGAAERLDLRTPQQAVPLIGAMAAAHAVIGVTIAVLAYGSKVTADPLAAFIIPALIAAAAAAAGVARRCGFGPALRPYVDDAAVVGVRAAVLGMAALLMAGAAVFTAASVWSIPTMHMLFGVNAPGFGGGFGMLLLCLAYVPNAVVAATAFVVGPGVSIDSLWVSPFGFEGGDVPGVPLLAALPEEHNVWWPVVLVVPAVIGALVGWTVRRSSPDPLQRLRSVGVAGALIGFTIVLLGTFAGGQLGAGTSEAVLLHVGFSSVAAFCWIALPGALVVWFAGERPKRVKAEDSESAEDAAEDTEEVEDIEEVEDAESAEDAAEAEEADGDGSEDAESDENATDEDAPEEAEAAVAEVEEELPDVDGVPPDVNAAEATEAVASEEDAASGEDAEADTKS